MKEAVFNFTSHGQEFLKTRLQGVCLSGTRFDLKEGDLIPPPILFAADPFIQARCLFQMPPRLLEITEFTLRLREIVQGCRLTSAVIEERKVIDSEFPLACRSDPILALR